MYCLYCMTTVCTVPTVQHYTLFSSVTFQYLFIFISQPSHFSSCSFLNLNIYKFLNAYFLFFKYFLPCAYLICFPVFMHFLYICAFIFLSPLRNVCVSLPLSVNLFVFFSCHFLFVCLSLTLLSLRLIFLAVIYLLLSFSSSSLFS
jgi:hypothetical protein